MFSLYLLLCQSSLFSDCHSKSRYVRMTYWSYVVQMHVLRLNTVNSLDHTVLCNEKRELAFSLFYFLYIVTLMIAKPRERYVCVTSLILLVIISKRLINKIFCNNLNEKHWWHLMVQLLNTTFQLIDRGCTECYVPAELILTTLRIQSTILNMDAWLGFVII